jgi:hypothetical protein
MTLCLSARAGEIPINISGLANEPWDFQGPTHILNPSRNFWLGAGAAEQYQHRSGVDDEGIRQPSADKRNDHRYPR